ncbi:hypothetical protein LSAT2_003761 [Lamellibrachia satsuma]|nr:hypothetical protein LSAT2_003761 [Lamellibrachia satsuma]
MCGDSLSTVLKVFIGIFSGPHDLLFFIFCSSFWISSMDQLNKPKCDVALQTEVEVTDVALQTEVEVTDVALQTEVEVTDVTFQTELDVTETSVQTQEVRMGDTATQTDRLTSDVKSSQTQHVASVHQFVQTEDYKKEDNEEGRKDESNSSMQTESSASTEPVPVPSTPSATRLDSTDYSTDCSSQKAVHEHSINVTVLCEDQKNSQQLEVDKCSNEIQRPVDTIPVLPTVTISDTATLKPLGHSRKDAIVTQKGDNKSVEVDTKRRRLTEAQPDKSGTTSHRYTFQFIDFPEPTVAPPVAQLPSIRPKGPQSSRTKSPVGILHDPKVQRQRSMKRVTFMRDRDTRPVGGSTDTWRTAGSFDQLQNHWENIHGAFDDMSTAVGLHPPGTSLKSEACFDDNDDTVLFSDDEPAGFEIGSQVERIEHFLLSDRLDLSKSHSSKLQ